MQNVALEAGTRQHREISEWRSRATNHRKNLADLLIERASGGMGVQGAYLYEHPELFGRSPRSRISDLIHQHGWDIGSKPGEHGCAFYWVRRDDDGRSYPTQRFDGPQTSGRPRLVVQPRPKFDDVGLLFDVSPRP